MKTLKTVPNKKNKFCNNSSNYIEFLRFREDLDYGMDQKELAIRDLIKKSNKAFVLLINKLENDSGLDLSEFELNNIVPDLLKDAKGHYRKEIERLSNFIYNKYEKTKQQQLTDKVLNFVDIVKKLEGEEKLSSYIEILEEVKKSELSYSFKIQCFKKLAELYIENYSLIK
jgi:hemerythrin